MAVGDYSDIVSPRARLALRQARGDGGNAAVFLKSDGASKVEFNGGGVDLLDLLERETRAFTYATRDGSQTVEVPFSHLVILQADEVDDARETATRFERAIDRRWRGYIDPALQARVEIQQAPGLDDETLVYFGQGVFAPPEGAKPVGAVKVTRLRDHVEPVEPTLPDGRAAAFYADQTALTFADSFKRAAAVCDVIEEPLALVLYKTRIGMDLRPDRKPSGFRVKVRPQLFPPNSRGSGGFIVSIDDVEAYVVAYDLETSPSRLLRTPEDAGLAISGIVAPSSDLAAFLRRSDFWWADLEADGSLAAGAFGQRAFSLCVEAGRLSAFDWSDYAFARGKEAGFRLESHATGGGIADRVVMMRKAQDRGAFGWLAMPERDASISASSYGGPSEYVLDWMRACIGAEGRADFRNWTRGFDFEGVSFSYSDEAIHASRPLLARTGEGEPFSPVRTIPRDPRAEILLGPLCLRIM